MVGGGGSSQNVGSTIRRWGRLPVERVDGVILPLPVSSFVAISPEEVNTLAFTKSAVCQRGGGTVKSPGTLKKKRARQSSIPSGGTGRGNRREKDAPTIE